MTRNAASPSGGGGPSAKSLHAGNVKWAFYILSGCLLVFVLGQMTALPSSRDAIFFLKDKFFSTSSNLSSSMINDDDAVTNNQSDQEIYNSTTIRIETIIKTTTTTPATTADKKSGYVYEKIQYPATAFTDASELFAVSRQYARNSNNTKNLVILLWTKLFHRQDWALGELGEKPFKKLGCLVSNCFVTDDRRYLPNASAVLVNFRDDFDFSDRPLNRPQKQHWIFFLWESPEHTYHWVWTYNYQSERHLQKFAGFFNWTMTYRLDSDIPFLYGRFVQNPVPKDELLNVDHLAKKTKSVIWIQSNCDTRSHRTQFVQELQKYIDVEVIGGCGSPNTQLTSGICSRPNIFTPMKPECLDYISSTYKFYLATENSLCRDYVTEKFFRGASLNTIPVVFNGANMSLFGPPYSYINANDFESPEKLAHFLTSIGNDAAKYNSYFQWKPYYDVTNFWDNDGFTRMFCDLCAKVTRAHLEPKKHAKVYEDIDDWWTTKGNCREGKKDF